MCPRVAWLRGWVGGQAEAGTVQSPAGHSRSNTPRLSLTSQRPTGPSGEQVRGRGAASPDDDLTRVTAGKHKWSWRGVLHMCNCSSVTAMPLPEPRDGRKASVLRVGSPQGRPGGQGGGPGAGPPSGPTSGGGGSGAAAGGSLGGGTGPSTGSGVIGAGGAGSGDDVARRNSRLWATLSKEEAGRGGAPSSALSSAAPAQLARPHSARQRPGGGIFTRGGALAPLLHARVAVSSAWVVPPSLAFLNALNSFLVPLLEPLCRLRDDVAVRVGAAAVSALLTSLEDVIKAAKRAHGCRLTPLVRLGA